MLRCVGVRDGRESVFVHAGASQPIKPLGAGALPASVPGAFRSGVLLTGCAFVREGTTVGAHDLTSGVGLWEGTDMVVLIRGAQRLNCKPPSWKEANVRSCMAANVNRNFRRRWPLCKNEAMQLQLQLNRSAFVGGAADARLVLANERVCGARRRPKSWLQLCAANVERRFECVAKFCGMASC